LVIGVSVVDKENEKGKTKNGRWLLLPFFLFHFSFFVLFLLVLVK